jgi:hypothetical protein
MGDSMAQSNRSHLVTTLCAWKGSARQHRHWRAHDGCTSPGRGGGSPGMPGDRRTMLEYPPTRGVLQDSS